METEFWNWSQTLPCGCKIRAKVLTNARHEYGGITEVHLEHHTPDVDR